MRIKKPVGRRKTILIVSSVIGFFLIALFVLNRILEPVVRARLHTFIIQGSDSLYRYSLGDLHVHFLRGSVEVENLQIDVDSNRYRRLEKLNQLPSLTMQLNLQKGTISGMDLLSLLFSKKIHISEVRSTEANIRLSRHHHPEPKTVRNVPIWKSIRNDIKKLTVDKIRLDGLKLLYKHADTSESAKLQFDRCEAIFEDVVIDSASSEDPERVAFSKNIDIGFEDMKFRTADSTYKMKATGIRYSTYRKTLEADSFKLQPTLEKADFYRNTQHQKELYFLQLEKFRLVNANLDQLINNDILEADSMLFENPIIEVYDDLTARYPSFESKMGKYPQQRLLSVPAAVHISHALMINGKAAYTEKSPLSGREGTVGFTNIQMHAENITNIPRLIASNPVCVAKASGIALGKSPFELSLKFFLDAPDGRYEANGEVKNISAVQLNPVSQPLANVQLNSLLVDEVSFHVNGSDNRAISDVSMNYNNLFLTIKKTDTATGATTTNAFATKVLNGLALRHNNPENGYQKNAAGISVLRISSQSFFGLLWKAVFAGIQSIIMKAS